MRERKGLISETTGLGIRSELSADTDAEAAGASSHSTLKSPRKQCQQGQNSAGSSPVTAQAGGHLAPSDVATGCRQEAISLSGSQRRRTVGSELRFAPGWLRHHEQASSGLGFIVIKRLKEKQLRP